VGQPALRLAGAPAHRLRLVIARMRRMLTLFDAVRIDHFRGFAGYWRSGGAKTAVGGRWLPGPGRELFDALAAALGRCRWSPKTSASSHRRRGAARRPRPARDGDFAVRILAVAAQFVCALPAPCQPGRLHGTHDNNTTLGWFLGEATDGERDFLRRYLDSDAREVHWDLIRAALASVADLAVVPHQDLAGLGADCRMNTPSTADGNWRFRLTGWMLGEGLQRRLADLVWLYGRSAATRPKPEAG